jgi:hypothetical protein
MTQRNTLEETWEAAREKFTDLDERSEQIMQAAQRAPKLAEGLLSGDPAERLSTMENLYYLAGGMAGLQPGSQPASTEAAAALQQAARDAKLDGTVASQTTTTDPEQPDEGEQWLERMGFNAVLDRYSPAE